MDSMGIRGHMVAPAALRALINAISATPFSIVAFVCNVAVDSTNQRLRISPRPAKAVMMNTINDVLTTKVGQSALMMPKAPAVSSTLSKKAAEASAPPPPT